MDEKIIPDLIQLNKVVSRIIKRHFTNLNVEQTLDISGEIVVAVHQLIKELNNNQT